MAVALSVRRRLRSQGLPAMRNWRCVPVHPPLHLQVQATHRCSRCDESILCRPRVPRVWQVELWKGRLAWHYYPPATGLIDLACKQ